MNERCQLGLAAETLSAWRAKALPASKQHEIAAHVVNCSVCQATLAGFERVAQLLRTPPPMPAQAAVWRGVQASITAPRGNMRKSQHILTFTRMITAASLVAILAIVFVVLNNRAGQPHSRPSVGVPSSIAMPASSPTPTVAALQTPLPSQGWVTIPELNFVKNLTFSASDPLTGYACGNMGSSATAPLEMSVTDDGGRTWQAPITTTVPGAYCYVYVNPTTSKDIIMLNYGCWESCNSGVYRPYRSLDGGQTWTQLLVPADDANDTLGRPAWIGNTVYFLVQALISTSFAHTIIANTSGSLLTPITDSQLFGGAHSGTLAIQNIWTSPNALFVALNVNGPTLLFAKTVDNGNTWQTFTGSGAIPLEISTFESTVNNPLIGNTAQNRLTISHDNGMTWQQLPPVPQIANGGSFGFFITSTANGTVLIQIFSSNNLWALTPNTPSWKNVCPRPLDGYTGVKAISTDATGQPILVWAGSSDTTLTPNGLPQPGIAYHSLNE